MTTDELNELYVLHDLWNVLGGDIIIPELRAYKMKLMRVLSEQLKNSYSVHKI